MTLLPAFGFMSALLQAQPAVDLHHDFRGAAALPAFLKLIGPDVDKFARPEPEGLRITLPAKRKPAAPVGVRLTSHLSGDFEITGSFEVVAADIPPRGEGLTIALNITTDNNYTKFAKV